MRVYASPKGTICSRDSQRVNSASKQKENTHFFKALISDSIDLLDQGKPCFVFTQEQLDELAKHRDITYKYIEKDKYFIVIRKGGKL